MHQNLDPETRLERVIDLVTYVETLETLADQNMLSSNPELVSNGRCGLLGFVRGELAAVRDGLKAM